MPQNQRRIRYTDQQGRSMRSQVVTQTKKYDFDEDWRLNERMEQGGWVNFNYDYSDCDTIEEDVRGFLTRNGLCEPENLMKEIRTSLNPDNLRLRYGLLFKQLSSANPMHLIVWTEP